MAEPLHEQQEDASLPYQPTDESIDTGDSDSQSNHASDNVTVLDDKAFQPIDPRYVPCERLASLILFIGTTLGSVIAYAAMWVSGAEAVLMILAAIASSVICLGLLWNTIFWPPIEYRHIRWQLSDVGLEIRRGVFWKHQIAIPWARAQHADVSQGPLQRMFEIGSLTIHTAGTKNSSVTIDGLAHSQAIEMRDEIIRQRKEHDVV
ncbi:PH domain-containing protein [bacterium]|nr:PH domain-containing protein [bacterium]